MKNLALLLVCFVFTTVQAQTGEPKYNFRDSDKIIKVDFTDIFSTIPTLGIDVESRVNEEISLQYGVGIIPSYFQPWVGDRQNDFDRLTGYQLRTEGRAYIFKKPTRYLAADLTFRHLVIRENDVPVGMDPTENPNGIDDFAYFVNTKMRFHQFNTSLALKWGFQRNLGDNFVFDLNVGLRLNNINVQSRSKLPTGGILPDDWNNRLTLVDNYRDSNVRPTVAFKIGYRL